jgi:signal transduction histidine kinase
MRRYVLVCDDEIGVLESYQQYLVSPPSSALDRLRRLKGGGTTPARGPLPDGWELVCARSGEEALELGARIAADGGELCVGFFDVKMAPGIDGIETMLRLLERFPRLRCAVVSAYNDRSVDQINSLFRVEHQDRWDFLAKPFTESEIRQKARMLAALWLCADAEARARAELAELNRTLAARVDERTRELEQSRAQMAASERLVALGTLAAGIGHEVNNPLAYVIANLRFIAEELEGEHRVGEIRRMLAESRDGAERIRKIVGGLNALVRRRDDARQPVDLAAVLDRALAMTVTETRHRARVVRRLGPAPRVLADDARLTQVFINLLVNAAQAIREGRASENEIAVATSTDADGRAVVEIRDTGCGIAPEHVPRIFDPFFTTKPVGEGSGLGLAISHGIVTGLGGTIAVESAPGRGTCFRVVLPAASAAVSLETVPVRPVEAGRRGRILVIDDEPAIGAAIRRFLREHDVVAVASGRAGLDLLDGGDRFDAIFCDLMMPDVTGMEIHAALAERAPDQAGRMVLMTGGAFSGGAAEFLERVGNPRLDKPFDWDDVRELARRLVRS